MTGSDDEIREYLASILGTPAFRLSAGNEIELELPARLEGGDGSRPTADAGTVVVRFAGCGSQHGYSVTRASARSPESSMTRQGIGCLEALVYGAR